MFERRLKNINKTTDIAFFNSAVENGTHCPMRIASNTIESVAGISSILIGMPECSIYSRIFNYDYISKDGDFHWLYVMDKKEVVFGARKGIINSLYELNKLGKKKVLLISTCIPEIIGEDLESIIFEVESKTDMKIAFVNLGHFNNISFNIGAWKVMEILTKFMGKKGKPESLVNIIGLSPTKKRKNTIIEEMKNKGIKINYISRDASLENLIVAGNAKMNIVFSSFGYPLAKEMKKRFSIPYINLHLSYSSEEIKSNLRRIEEYLKISLVEEMEDEYKKLKILEDKYKESGKKYNFAFGQKVDLPLSIAEYLMGLGNEISFMHLEELIEEERVKREILLENRVNPLVGRIVGKESIEEKLKELKVNGIIGSISLEDEYEINLPNIFSLYGMVGFERSMALIKLIYDNRRANGII